MPDDVLIKAEAYVDDCIASMDERDRPSAAQRMRAVEQVESHTRRLIKALR